MNLPTAIGRWPISSIVRSVGPRLVVSWSRDDCSPKKRPSPHCSLWARYVYRAWVTNLSLTPAGIWHFYDGRAVMELRIGELREDYALRKIPTRSFEANA